MLFPMDLINDFAPIGEYFIVADSHRDCHAKLSPDSFSQLIRDFLTAAEETCTSRNIKPALIKTVQFDLIGVLAVNSRAVCEYFIYRS